EDRRDVQRAPRRLGERSASGRDSRRRRGRHRGRRCEWAARARRRPGSARLGAAGHRHERAPAAGDGRRQPPHGRRALRPREDRRPLPRPLPRDGAAGVNTVAYLVLVFACLAGGAVGSPVILYVGALLLPMLQVMPTPVGTILAATNVFLAG